MHSNAQEILDAAVNLLRQGEEVLMKLSAENYTRKIALAFNGSIGGHYRHCLDHFRSLLRAEATEELNYDDRERNPQIETDLPTALSETRALRHAFEQLPPQIVDRPLRAGCKVNYGASAPQWAPSNFGREVIYAVAHAVHHFALIAIIARAMDLSLPLHCGIAPSTLDHQLALRQERARPPIDRVHGR